MELNISVCLLLFLIPLSFPKYQSYTPTIKYQKLKIGEPTIDKTQAFALIFSFIQCFPTNTSYELDLPSQSLLHIHQNFHPLYYLDEYTNATAIKILVDFVNFLEISNTSKTLPFTNAPKDIAEFQTIFTVLYHNSENWFIFYCTSCWLLQRVNQAQLFWALVIVATEKYTNIVTVPSAVEIFPQFFIPKELVLQAAAVYPATVAAARHPLHYWMGDPGLNQFHTHWHMNNPFWWDETVYGVKRDRKGELLLYLHHQFVTRYNAERRCLELPEVDSLELEPDYKIPEGFDPDVLNVDYSEYFMRVDNQNLGIYDDENATLINNLRAWEMRLNKGSDNGYFLNPEGDHVEIRGFNGPDIFGATLEPSLVLSANLPYYGSYHNFIHRLTAGMMKPEMFPVPGIQAHSETSMRDPLFYRIHTKVDTVFLKYKRSLPPYTPEELDFPGVEIAAIKIVAKYEGSGTEILKTYFRKEIYDITNAARPCRGVNEKAVPVSVQVLDYEPFSYWIQVQSTRSTVAHGMVRIFLWPETTQDGTPLEGDAAHERAIEMDRFRVTINPNEVTLIERSSLDAEFTEVEPAPGIKKLYRKSSKIRRACAFPNNLLLPRGKKEGLPFKLTVYLSEESEKEPKYYSHYTFCGALNGSPFPDSKPMAFPFDRYGTRFNLTVSTDYPSNYGSTSMMIKNVKEMRIIIKHVAK